MKKTSRILIILVLQLLVCLAAKPCIAQTYDATADFSPTNNPNGVWSYGWTPNLGGAFTLYDAERTIPFVGPSGEEWYPSSLADADRPDLVYWQGELTMAAGPAGQYSVVRWTVPAAGTYSVSGTFGGFWDQPVVDGDVHVLVHTQSSTTHIFDGAIEGSSYPAVPFSGTVTVSQGDTIDFVLGYGANQTNSWDRAILTAKITLGGPTIILTSPVDGGSYLLNQAVAADYTCTDDGSGLASCTGTVPSGSNIDTASVGSKTFTVSATDNAGNTANKTVTYTVAYDVGALYDQTKAHKSGSTVPIKIQLLDAGGENVSSSSIVVHATGVTVVSGNAPGPLDDSGAANPDLDFRYDATLGGYIFNLSLKGYTTGTYNLNFTVGNDPIIHSVQFQVK